MGGKIAERRFDPAETSAVGLDPAAFGQDSGGRDFYGTPLPRGVGYDLGAHQSR